VEQSDFVAWFRQSSPYINAHRGRTFVLMLSGDAVEAAAFPSIAHDIALLSSLGARLVVVFGVRPQVEACLMEQGGASTYESALRITDLLALDCVKRSAGSVRVEIEALLSMGLANSPMTGARIRTAGGNLVMARPLGVSDGVDYLHTGVVRRVDVEGITGHLDNGAIVLLPPIGYSPTGEVFNLSAEDVATAAAIALSADKLIFLHEGSGLRDSRRQLIRQITSSEVEETLKRRRRMPAVLRRHLTAAAHATHYGVDRVHLISWKLDGALLRELFTRDGIGTLVTAEPFEKIRKADIEDVAGLLELIEPLEQLGLLVKRPRERLELEIGHFMVVEKDGAVIGSAALYPFEKEHIAEIACLTVHPDYRDQGLGARLLEAAADQARELGLKRVFVLSTQGAHWFREQGFKSTDIRALPVKRRALYNYQRNSRVFVKIL